MIHHDTARAGLCDRCTSAGADGAAAPSTGGPRRMRGSAARKGPTQSRARLTPEPPTPAPPRPGRRGPAYNGRGWEDAAAVPGSRAHACPGDRRRSLLPVPGGRGVKALNAGSGRQGVGDARRAGHLDRCRAERAVGTCPGVDRGFAACSKLLTRHPIAGLHHPGRLTELQLPYSARSTVAGASAVARRAGSQAASPARSANSTGTATYVAGSQGLTPKS